MLRSLIFRVLVAIAAVIGTTWPTYAGHQHVRFHGGWGWSHPYCKPAIKWVRWYDAWGDKHMTRLKVFDRRCPLPRALPPRHRSFSDVGSYHGYW